MKRKLRVKRLRVEGLRRLAIGLVLLSTLNFQLSTSLAIEEMAVDAQGNQLPLRAKPATPGATPYPMNLRPDVWLAGQNLLDRIAAAAASGGGGGGVSLPPAAARGIEKQIYIALRTDGLPGLGTKEDPFDGSTRAKFDALLGVSGSIGADTHVHLGPGTFLTNQTKFRENIIIEGAGKYLTTVKLADGAAQTAGSWKVFGSSALPFYNYVSLRNLTIDTNKANQGVYIGNIEGATLYAIRALANSADIINVRALNIWNENDTPTEGAEGFPFSVVHDAVALPEQNIVFDGCDVIDPIGYHTAISAFGNVTPTDIDHHRLTIKNCLVTNHLGGSCFGGGGEWLTEIFNNTAINCATGSTMDTGDFKKTRIHDNRFIDMNTGINLNGAGTYTNVAIYNNLFVMKTGAVNGAVSSNATLPTYSGLQFFGNTVIQPSTTAPGLKLGGANSSGFVRNNVITEVVPTDLSSTLMEVSGNTAPDGTPLGLRSASSVTSKQLAQALLDPDVATFYANALSNGGAVSTTTTSALNKLVVGFKADGTWAKIISYDPLCGDYAASVTKLKYPAGASPFLINSGFTSGDYVETGATGGYKPNGTTIKILDTGYNPVAASASESSFAIGAYVSGIEADGVSRVIMGNQADAGGTQRTILGWVSGGSVEAGSIASTSGGSAGATKRDGLLVVTCNGNRTQNYYDDAVFIASTAGSGTFVNSTFYLNAVRSAGGALGLSTRYLRTAFIATGLSAADVASMTTRIQAFQTVLGRQVGAASYEPFNVTGSVVATGNIQTGSSSAVIGYSGNFEGPISSPDGSGIGNLDARRVSWPARDVTGSSATITSDDVVIRHSVIPGGGCADQLPAGFNGALIYIEDTSHTAGTNNITITTAGAETFTSGGTSKTIAVNGRQLKLEWNGTKWFATISDAL